jgi:hypothetical protein
MILLEQSNKWSVQTRLGFVWKDLDDIRAPLYLKVEPLAQKALSLIWSRCR